MYISEIVFTEQIIFVEKLYVEGEDVEVLSESF